MSSTAVRAEDQANSPGGKAAAVPPVEITEPRSRGLVGWVQWVIKLLVASLVIVLPLFFGGVHPSVYLSVEILIFAGVALMLAVHPKSLVNACSSSSAVRMTLLSFVLFAALASGSLIFRMFNEISHPILGVIHTGPSIEQLGIVVKDLVFAIGLFALMCGFLFSSPRNPSRVRNWILTSAAFVSLTALSHWFYDNGLLFWTFEPENVFQSERARWPFVNSDHLAHFSLLVLFPLLGFLEESALQFRESKGGPKPKRMLDALTRRRFQWQLVRFLSVCMLLLCVVLAILGTQSRGSWFALGVTLVLYILGSGRAKTACSASGRAPADLMEKSGAHATHDKRGRHRSRRRSAEETISAQIDLAAIILRRLYRPLLFIGALLVITFFLNERGRELVAGRIEYGLLYSMDDIRWAMYENSWPMFLSAPFWGVGLGYWDKLYSQFTTLALADLNPVYLHSDPLQLLIEVGLIGILPLLFLGIYLIRTTSRLILCKADASLHALKLRVLGGVCALFSFTLAGLFDFPFRIPALLSLYLITLAMLLINCTLLEDGVNRPS